MAPIRLVTFDVTNTIVRVAGSVGKQYANVAQMCLNRTLDPGVINNSFKDAYRYQIQKHPNFGANSGISTSEWWTDVVCKTLIDAKYEIADVDLLRVSEELYQYFCTKGAWEVLPLAEQTLMTLKSRGLNLGVVSNFDERLETILENVSLKKYFDFILASSVEKIEKPNKEIFIKALDIAGVSPTESLHVGDNVTTDYFGANGAGIQGLLVWNKDKELPSNVDNKFVLSGIQEITKFV